MIIWVFGLVLFLALTALAIIDYRTMILPDKLTLPLIMLGFFFAYSQDPHTQSVLRNNVLGAVIGYFALVSLELFYKKFRGADGLGRGDAKLLSAGGAWCGWAGLPFIVLIASASGLLHALLLSRNQPHQQKTVPIKLPFGPHLSLGIFITWVSLFVLN